MENKYFECPYCFNDFVIGDRYIVTKVTDSLAAPSILGEKCTVVVCDKLDFSIGLAFDKNIDGSSLFTSDNGDNCDQGHGLWYWAGDVNWFLIEKIEDAENNQRSINNMADLQKLFD